MSFNDVQIWDNAAFDNNTEFENSTAIKYSWSTMNLSQSSETDSTKENQTPLKPLLGQTQSQDLDMEINKVEKQINLLSIRLESLRLEKAKRSVKVIEKRGRIIAAKFMEQQPKPEEEVCVPRRGLSLCPAEIVRGGGRRGISLGPSEIYSATKLKQTVTPVNRRKSCYWKLQDVDELRATKERGKSASLSPKTRSKMVPKSLPLKQGVTTGGLRKTVKKEDGVISTIQPKKLFVEKSAKKPLKSGRVVPSRYNQVGNSAVKELRKRSLNGNEEDCCKRFEKKRVSLVEEQLGNEARVKKKWEIPNEVVIQKGVEHKTPLSVSKMVDMVPKIKTLRFKDGNSPRDSGAAKRVSELVGRKSFFSMDNDDDSDEEEIIKGCPQIRLLSCVDESVRDSGAVKRVSQMIGKRSLFDDDEMPRFSFEDEEN